MAELWGAFDELNPWLSQAAEGIEKTGGSGGAGRLESVKQPEAEVVGASYVPGTKREALAHALFPFI